ncbi:Protein roadkill-like protein [Aphelenchoides fujianensis]|nr:Protein roadkill-like protein [Aphelenchoides fujianensis]
MTVSSRLSRADPNVASWEVPDFSQRVAGAQAGDLWTGEPHVLELPDGRSIQYVLEFRPCGTRKTDGRSSALHLRLLGEPAAIPLMEVSAWIERADGTTSGLKKGLFDFSTKASIGWAAFLFAEERAALANEPLVFCCRFPWAVRRTHVLSDHPTEFRFEVPDFSCRIAATAFTESWEGGPFVVAGVNGAKWTVDFQPTGSIEGKAGHCAVWIQAEGLDSAVFVQQEVWIEGREGRRSHKYAVHRSFDAKNPRHGWNSFLSQEDLLQLAAGGPIAVCCTVRPLLEAVESSGCTPFRRQLAETFMREKYADFEIHADGQVFPASKAIVCSQSPVFDAMFEPGTREHETNVVEIRDLPAGVVRQMLYFLYAGVVRDLDAVALELLSVADRYELPLLVKMCTDSIVQQLSLKTIVDALELAFRLPHCEVFRARVFRFARENRAEVIALPEWAELAPIHSEILAEMDHE